MNKKPYETPVVEMLEAKVERGFAGSANTPEPQGTEQLTEGNSYIFS